LMEISSTFIREAIRAGKDIRFFLSSEVWEEIQAAALYRN